MLLIKKIFLPLLCFHLFIFPLPQSNFSMDEILYWQQQRLSMMQIEQIGAMIQKLANRISSKRRQKLAANIWRISRQHQIRPQIMLAIIGTESDFIQDRISHTGDLSLAQINPRIWNKELSRLGRSPLQIERLKQDEVYALKRMGEILSILKSRHAKKDSNWFGRYHSKTHFLKKRYTQKVQAKLQILASL